MSPWDGLDELVAVADTGSFTAGARLLRMSTSHVSRAIASLEARVGAQIFNRTTRVVSLTDTGRALADHCRRMIAERDEALAIVNGAPEPQGEIRMTCSTALGERFVAPIVRRFAQAYSKLSVQLELSNRIVDLVGEGFDLAIRTGTIADPRLVGRQIATRRLYLCAAPSYLAREGTPHQIQDLNAHNCLIATSAIWHFIDGTRQLHFKPSGRWQCNNGTVIRDAAAAGLGICQLPGFYVKQAIANGSLISIMDQLQPSADPIWAVYPRRRHLLPKVHMLVDQLEIELDPLLNSADFDFGD